MVPWRLKKNNQRKFYIFFLKFIIINVILFHMCLDWQKSKPDVYHITKEVLMTIFTQSLMTSMH